jgi:heme/copper-type cytochrome/quinol oxidase subunit 2
MRSTSRRRRVHVIVSLTGLLLGFVAAASLPSPARGQEGGRREITVVARKFAFEPSVIEVDENDLVKITVTTEDIAHSFTLDAYRIARRAAPGQPTTFEFRADRAGTFPFYCNLKVDDGCKDMKGTLVVRAR